MRTRLMNTRSWLHRRRLLLDGGEPAPTDPYWDNVSLLLDMDGVDGGTETTDLSDNGHTQIFTANAALTDAQSKFGDFSLDLDGTGDYVSMADDATLSLGSEDFTMEAHVRFDVVDASGQIFISKWAGSGNREYIFGRRVGAGEFSFGYSNDGGAHAQNLIAEAWTPSVDTWYHVAISRTDTETKGFIDGVQKGATFDGEYTIHDNGVQTYVGVHAHAGIGEEMDGRITNVRITKGVGRYTENFTPPSAAYPTS